MSRSLFRALPELSRQSSRKPTSPSTPPRTVRIGSCLLIPLLMSGCVYHHPPMPVQKSAVMLPKPAPRLLAEMPEPKCTFTDEDPVAAAGVVTANAEPASSTTESSPVAEQAPSETAALAEAVQRRERERDCFRDAEARVRAKLAKLQSSVRAMMQGIEKQKRKLASAR